MPQKSLNGQIQVPYSFFLPVYGYLKFWLPSELKQKRWLVIIENIGFYTFIGLVLGILNLHFTTVGRGLEFIAELAVVFLFEAFLYYTGIIQGVFKKSVTQAKDGNAKSKAIIGYLFTQGQVLWFTAASWFLVDIIRVILLWI